MTDSRFFLKVLLLLILVAGAIPPCSAYKPVLVVQTGHSQSVSSVAFSPDGRTLASDSGDDTIKLWDVLSGKELHVLAGNSGWVSSVVFSPDGSAA